MVLSPQELAALAWACSCGRVYAVSGPPRTGLPLGEPCPLTGLASSPAPHAVPSEREGAAKLSI